MYLAPARDDHGESLLSDFARAAIPPAPDAIPLIGSFVVPSPHNSLPEWPMANISRCPPTDARYEFSLNPAADFDTDSIDAHVSHSESRPLDDDDASTNPPGTSTSEDTSLPTDVSNHVSNHSGVSSHNHHKSELFFQGMQIVNNATILPSSSYNPASTLQITSASQLPKKQHRNTKPTNIIKKQASVTNKSTRVSALNLSALASATTSNNESGPLSHTKMCRDRLKKMFDRLKSTLPPAPPGVEVKHKAQVLDHAIAVLKEMVERINQLEIELAVSSNKATMEWISKLVNRVDTFSDTAHEVMNLFSQRRAWKHAELWIAQKTASRPDADQEQSVILTFGRAIANDPQGECKPSLDEFSRESEAYVFKAKEGVQGRVWASLRPEWVVGLHKHSNFKRASLAKKYGVKVCLAVPVTITGKIEAVLCFYDIKHRPYDTQCLELAMKLSWALGTAVGGKRAKMTHLTASGS